MWIVAKVRSKELSTFKNNLLEKLGKDIKYYHPKVEYYKYFKDKVKRIELPILENYIFCYHSQFEKTNFLSALRFIKGLEYFLKGHQASQKEILKFINYCKSFENEKGYLKQTFFKAKIINKGKFISGPFSNMVFVILERQKNKLKILVGNIVTTISDNKNYIYRPI